MNELLEFAGAHPIVAIVSLALLVQMPVAIIRALKHKNTDTDD